MSRRTKNRGPSSATARDIASGFDAEVYPHLVAFTVEHVFQPGYEFSDTFEFGIDLILDSLARLAEAS